MKVYKPVNHHIVSAIDDTRREVVVIGKGKSSNTLCQKGKSAA